MFNTLESTWDHSARRGWSTAASFGFQLLAVSLLLAIPLIWIQGPPRLQWVRTTDSLSVMTPEVVPEPVRGQGRPGSINQIPRLPIVTPREIPKGTPALNDADVEPPGENILDRRFGVTNSDAVRFGIGDRIPVALPKPPTPPPSRPIRLSHWAEGNIIFRLQPLYPPLARQVRIQGTVQLRAIISKTGIIENLTVISGHPMLSGAAIDAVRQWRYRPYLLNNEPVEIETEITVNFVLSGN